MSETFYSERFVGNEALFSTLNHINRRICTKKKSFSRLRKIRMALDLLEHTSFVCQTKKFEFDNTIEDTHYVQEHSVNLFTIESF